MSLIQKVADRIKELKLPSEIPVALELTTSVPAVENLTLLEFKGEEKLNDCFCFDLTCVSPKFDMDYQKLIGEEVHIAFRYGDKNAQMRYIHGVVGEVRQGPTNVDDLDRQAVDKPKTFKIKQMVGDREVTKEVVVPRPETTIYLKIFPSLWTTKFTKNYRIFQEKKTLDIIKEILGAHPKIQNIRYDTTTCGETLREYCVQYNESDYDFITRLMAEDGLYFYYEHTAESHTLIVADAATNHKALDGMQQIQTQQFRPDKPLPNYIQAIELCEQKVVENVMTTDYNFETPSADMSVRESDPSAPERVYHYPGRFAKAEEGAVNIKHKQEYYAWQKGMVQGRSTIFGFQAGKSFTLADHIRIDANKRYVLHTVKHEASIDLKKGRFVYQNAFIAFDYATPFRSNPFHKKPLIPSTQTAIVTGKEGEEIWTDDLGRIKIQFPWDQEGEKNEQTTCWVRVQQVWAGNNWGFIFVPRIGMEVVVSFINGDPDRPLVTGCVYNRENLPPSVGEDPKRSTIRTKSTKEDTEGRFHELTFDDTLKNERIYMHSSHNLDIDVQNQRTLTVHNTHDLTTLLAEEGNGNQVITLKKGNRAVRLNQGSQVYTLMEGDLLQILQQGNSSEILAGGNKLISASGNELHALGGTFGLACGNVGVSCGGVSFSASAANMAGSASVSGATSDDGSGIPSVTSPTDPAEQADSSTVKAEIQGMDVKTDIMGGNMSLNVTGGNREATITGDDTLTVMGNISQTVTGNYELTVMGDFKLTVMGKVNITTTGGAEITSMQDLKMTAMTSLEMMGTIGVKAEAGANLELKAGAMCSVEGGAQADIKGGAMVMIQGGVVKLN